MPKITKEIRKLQAKGYPVKNVLDLIQNDDNTHTVVYTSPDFQPCPETFSERYAFVGPCIRPAEVEIEKTAEKLIYISMGTVNNDMLPLYRRCISALASTGYQVILSVGHLVALEDFGPLPEHVTVVPSIDQIGVLQKADVFLSHCGMNSASESLYFGVPLVMLPQTAEQGAVAERINQLGAGVKLEKTDESSILAAIKEVLSDPVYRENAAKIGDGFRRCPGAQGAADKILQVCGK